VQAIDRWRSDLVPGTGTEAVSPFEFCRVVRVGNCRIDRRLNIGTNCKPYFTGKRKGWVALDSFSASAIVAVWDALTEVNREKYAKLHLVTMARVAFKLCK
jgi:hypothetical protein